MATPRKPYPDFPLTPRGDGRWQKKIAGRTHYFRGTAEEALAEYREMIEGRVGPRGRRVKDLLNELLTDKQRRVENGELSPRTWGTWKAGCDAVMEHFGPNRDVATIGPADFAALRPTLADGRGLVSLKNNINTVRGVFHFAYEAGVVDVPTRFGPAFSPPRKRALRAERAGGGDRTVTPAEFRALADAATDPFRAILLLGLNAAYGPTDCATLPASALDLAGGWAEYPRPKTESPRRAALWPETVDALAEAAEGRPRPRDGADAGLAFLTRQRGRWGGSRVSPRGTVVNYDQVSRRFRQLAEKAGVRRPGMTFYALRRTFRTVGDETLDQPACDLVMGHVSPGMAAVYRQRIGDDRLRAVAEHVRGWVGW